MAQSLQRSLAGVIIKPPNAPLSLGCRRPSFGYRLFLLPCPFLSVSGPKVLILSVSD